MSKNSCSSYWKPSAPKPIEVKCPKCGKVEEIWSDEDATCQCGTTINRTLVQKD